MGELLATRQSLLSRLKDWNDQESWRTFFDMYWRLIYTSALKAGLTDAEAQDVVQETITSVVKSMPDFQYSAINGSFKSWLLNLTRWRVLDQLRRRDTACQAQRRPAGTATETATIDRIADPAGLAPLEANWEREWEATLMDAALERVKRKVDAKHYQLFDLCVLQGWPVSKVAELLHVSRGKIYITRHRLTGLLKKEIAQLRTKPL